MRKLDKHQLLNLNISETQPLINRLLVFIIGEEAWNHVLYVASDLRGLVEQRHHFHIGISLQVQEAIQQVFVDIVAILAPDGRLEEFVEVDCVEKFLQLSVKDLHLVLEVGGEGIVRPDPLHHILASAEVAWVRTPVQLVLQRMLDLVFEIRGYVVAMGNVPDPSQRHCLHELVCKRGQVCLDTTDDEAVFVCLELVIQLLVKLIRDARVVIRSEMALLPAVNIPSRNEV